MSTTPLLVDISPSLIATITLNRAEINNAFDDVLIKELISTFEKLEQMPEIRAVVLRAAGKHFCAGGDVHWMRRMANASPAENLHDAHKLAELMHTLYFLCKPTIVLIQGAAYGGGVGLVACCDIAIAATNAKFCFSEVKLGLIPAVIGPYAIAAIGTRATRRYFLSAEPFSANEAHRLGLVHEVVEEDNLTAASDKILTQIINNAPVATSIAKKFILETISRTMDETLVQTTSDFLASLRTSPEAKEGLTAFLEKRPPSWAVKPKFRS